MANLESVKTYEGTHDIHNLILEGTLLVFNLLQEESDAIIFGKLEDLKIIV